MAEGFARTAALLQLLSPAGVSVLSVRVRLLGAAVHLGSPPGQSFLHLVHHAGHSSPGAPAHCTVAAAKKNVTVSSQLSELILPTLKPHFPVHYQSQS